MRDQFNERANQWDSTPWKIDLNEKIYQYIKEKVSFDSSAHLVDMGGGTGALALKFLDEVSTITVVDTSKGMLDVLRGKIEDNNLENVNIIENEIVEGVLENGSVDLLISAMTLHHVEDVFQQLDDMKHALSDGGKLAIIDLIEESGDFHPEGLEYVHNGFIKEDILEMFAFCGFSNIKFKVIYTIQKEVADGRMKNFPVFIVTAEK